VPNIPEPGSHHSSEGSLDVPVYWHHTFFTDRDLVKNLSADMDLVKNLNGDPGPAIRKT
jgi:hypothetical protein